MLLDVNIWIASLIATDKKRKGTAAQELVSMVSRGEWGNAARDVQLVISFEMLDTLETVLTRKGALPDKARAYCDAVLGIMRAGPDELDPYLMLGGRDQFAMKDREDAGVLATAFGSRTDLLITDNLNDFMTSDAMVVDTQTVLGTASTNRRLQALRHQRADVDVIVAHPFDVMDWMRKGYDFQPGKLWESISR